MLFSEPKIPQSFPGIHVADGVMGFSALQRAENSSIRISSAWLRADRYVSVLFSEPKIPQSAYKAYFAYLKRNVSVLFSEPKIPQFLKRQSVWLFGVRFSALQRAENSSIVDRADCV